MRWHCLYYWDGVTEHPRKTPAGKRQVNKTFRSEQATERRLTFGFASRLHCRLKV